MYVDNPLESSKGSEGSKTYPLKVTRQDIPEDAWLTFRKFEGNAFYEFDKDLPEEITEAHAGEFVGVHIRHTTVVTDDRHVFVFCKLHDTDEYSIEIPVSDTGQIQNVDLETDLVDVRGGYFYWFVMPDRPVEIEVVITAQE